MLEILKTFSLHQYIFTTHVVKKVHQIFRITSNNVKKWSNFSEGSIIVKNNCKTHIKKDEITAHFCSAGQFLEIRIKCYDFCMFLLGAEN